MKKKKKIFYYLSYVGFFLVVRFSESNWVNLFAAFLHAGLYQKSGKLLLLGLDNAGKTSLLQMLKDNRVGTNIPTQRSTNEEMTLGRIKFECYDLGGHKEAREIWSDYYVDASAIIYMVDSTDRKRFAESKQELDSLLTSNELKGVPIVVLGNKVDIQTAASEAELRGALGLAHTTGKSTKPGQLGSTMRPIEVFMSSVVNRFGYADGIKWLAQYI